MASSNVVTSQGPANLRGLFNEMWLVTATIDPASVAAEGVGSDTLTVKGLVLGDIVVAWSAGVAISDNLLVQVQVSAADTLKVQYANNNVAAGAAIDLGSATWTFLIARPRTSSNAS